MSAAAETRKRLELSQIKEIRTMPKRLAIITALLIATLLPVLSPAAPAQAEESPWQVLSGSRPSNLWEPDDEVQVIQKGAGITIFKVKGVNVLCMGSFLCPTLSGKPNSATAAQVQTALEAPIAYGPGGAVVVETSTGRFEVTSAGRWVPPLTTTSTGASASVLTEGGSGQLFVILTNLGDAPVDATTTPVTIADQLPAGIAGYNAEGFGGVQGKAGTVECELPSTAQVSCEFEGVLPSYEAIEVEIRVSATGSPPAAGAPGLISVSGGNAPSASAAQPVKVSPDPVAFGIEHFSAQAEEEGGAATAQAGLHPFQFVNTVQFKSGAQRGATRRFMVVDQPAQPRNTRVELPPGLVGNATAAPTCPMAVFLAPPPANLCPDASIVGVASATIVEATIFGLLRLATPIYNLPPQRGQPARFGFVAVTNPVTIDTAVDPDDSYRITGSVSNAPQNVQVLSATLSLWGNPSDSRHDSARGENCFLLRPAVYPGECGEPLQGASGTPFLRMPVGCDAPLSYLAEAEPWNTPLGSAVSRASWLSEPLAGLQGCNREPFTPTFSLAPTSKAAESPSGLDAEVSMPNEGLSSNQPGAVSETQFKRAVVTLPEGVTVNPSQAEGLATCSPADYGRERFDSLPGEGCPEASKIGSVKIRTPLLAEEAEGALYVATPRDNPFDSLIALYLVARIPDRGILVKQAGVVEPDPRTGQLVTTFDDVPQVPIDYFKLHFREGGRAPLVTPPRCGSFETSIRYTPWSAHDPDNPQPDEIVEQRVPFTIQRGVDGGACPPGGLPPFEPDFSAGTLSNQAGSYSPFLMRLTRRDGDQDLTKFSSILPPGVLGRIAGLERCAEAAIAAAKARTGKEELAAPSCPASSRIGATGAGAGVGSVLTYVPGSLYLAGPYNGAPLSVVAITPAVAGPFDVGTVVVRVALGLDPKSARVEVDGAASDPIPHILAGIPLKLRDLRVHVDRPDFTLNATSCEPSATLATLWGGFADVFSAADDVPVGREARYQAAGCQALGFKPRLAIRLKGGVRRGAHPALRAVVTPRPGDANFSNAAVTLPRSAFLDQGHIRTVCTRVQFNAGAGHGAQCPKGAIYGRARAWSPLLDEPASGPVFLRSSDNKLPDLVVALKGPASAPIDVEISSRIDSVRGGIRSTFAAIPDVPVSRFILDMQGGKKGLIVNSRNLCVKRKRNRAKANLTGQNGRRSNTKPVVRAVKCGKKRRRKASKSHARISRGARNARPGSAG